MGYSTSQQAIAYLTESGTQVVLKVEPLGKPSTDDLILGSVKQIENPQKFIDDIVAGSPNGAIIPVHPRTPDVPYAGTGRYGYVMSIDELFLAHVQKLMSK